MVAIRTVAVYLVILAVVRLMGKREIGNLGAFDFLVALMIGEIVDEAIYGDVSMLEFVVVVVIITGLELINSWGSFRSKTLRKILEAGPSQIVEHGKIKQKELARERFSEDDLWSQLRLKGVDDLQEVKEATIEPSGSISVVLEDWARPVQKGDLEKAG